MSPVVAEKEGTGMVNILGIDPSLTHTAAWQAVGPFDVQAPLASAGGLTLRSFAVKSAPKDHPHPAARLRALRVELTHHLDRCASEAPPGLCVVEGYAFAAKCSREALGEWGGQLRLAAHERGWLLVVVPPTVLKSFVCGAGNAPKERMMLETFKRWSYTSTDNNDADAYGLMQLGLEWTRWKAGEVRSKALSALLEKLTPWEAAAA